MKNEKLYVNQSSLETRWSSERTVCWDTDEEHYSDYCQTEMIIPKCAPGYQAKCPAIDDVSECEHTNQFVNDRCLFQCVDCGEELGR